METKNLEDITIQDMVDRVFVNTKVSKTRKELVDFYVQEMGVGLFGTDGENPVTAEAVGKRVDFVLSEDRKSECPYLTYKKRAYSKRTFSKTGPIKPVKDGNDGENPTTPPPSPDSNYIGKGGECLVMGELLFKGYNVNNMMVDEGIDIVASKENVFYYIQVKTINVTEANKFLFQVKWERYNNFIGTQMRYILVARCLISGQQRTVFFMFTNGDINRLLFDRCIPQPQNKQSYLSIKIEYDNRTGKAYMYDGRFRTDVSFNMNNFEL